MINTEKYRGQLQNVYTEKEAVKLWGTFAERYNADQKAAYFAFIGGCRDLFELYMDLVEDQNRALKLREETAEKIEPGNSEERARELPLYCLPTSRPFHRLPDYGAWLPEVNYFMRLGFLGAEEAASIKMILKDRYHDPEF